MNLIGITGLIGSGKSYICRIFEKKEIPVFYCDDEAKALYKTEPELKKAVFKWFDCETDGEVDTKKLGAIVFKDSTKLQLLERYVHLYFSQRFDNWIKLKEKEGHNFVLVENAVMFKNNFYKVFDLIIGISNHKEVRIQQAMNRDNCTREQVLDRMNKQLSETELNSKCDIVIHSGYNDNTLNNIVDDLIFYFNRM